MKCLSIRQPWATLIAIGAKKFETRSWATNYRGPLAIHAGLRWTREQAEMCEAEPFRTALRAAGIEVEAGFPVYANTHPVPKGTLPLGCVVAIGSVDACRDVGHLNPGEQERAFGDFRPGRYGWELSSVRRLALLIPYTGRQGLFSVPDDLIEQAVRP